MRCCEGRLAVADHMTGAYLDHADSYDWKKYASRWKIEKRKNPFPKTKILLQSL